jgi:glycolate oxidase subunit GlcD
LYYVPDPSSQPSCTIGGNLAENAGGIHCLKYGTTTDHVIAARVVLSDGSIVDLDLNRPGYDLLGTFVGSEGTFGIATEATVKLAPIPAAVRTLLADFLDVDAASRAVSAIIAAGMLPAALEMMDNAIIRAVEASVFTAGLPTDAQAVLLVELDGVEAGIDDEVEKAEAILRDHGARSVRRATDEKERKKLWAARKGAFGAVGRLMPDVMIQDAVVPRSRLPEVLADTYRISAKYHLQMANVFHAGDGNLHPLICFDLRRGADIENVRQAGREIMETCVRAGGSITGEHGVGLDKSAYLPLIFSEDDMDTMLRVRAAFDATGLCNPGKIIPMPKGCGEARAVANQTFSPLPVGEGQDEGLPRRNFVHPNPLPKGEGDESSLLRNDARGTASLVATRMNESRVARGLSQLLGDVGVRRLTDFTLDLRDNQQAERLIEVSPSSAEQASEVLEFATAERLAVIPAGARSFIATGNLLMQADVILSTRNMNRVVAHEPADLVATAEAGMTLREFQARLAEAGQWLPVDPPDEATATIGSVVATASAGHSLSGMGRCDLFVIGLRAILADGRRIKAGGNVVKNVAGYDLCKLFTGSYGTLGVITEVTFKLRPLPAETRTIVASGAREVYSVSPGRLRRTTLRLLSKFSHRLLAQDLGLSAKENEYATLIPLCRLLARGRYANGSDFEGAARCWSGVARPTTTITHCGNHFRTVPSQTKHNLSWSARVRSTELSALLTDSWLSRLMTRGSQQFAGMRELVMVVCVPSRAVPVYHQQAVRALERLRQTAEDRGGCLAGGASARGNQTRVRRWGDLGSAGELMKRVKQQLDRKTPFCRPADFLERRNDHHEHQTPSDVGAHIVRPRFRADVFAATDSRGGYRPRCFTRTGAGASRHCCVNE